MSFNDEYSRRFRHLYYGSSQDVYAGTTAFDGPAAAGPFRALPSPPPRPAQSPSALFWRGPPIRVSTGLSLGKSAARVRIVDSIDGDGVTDMGSAIGGEACGDGRLYCNGSSLASDSDDDGFDDGDDDYEGAGDEACSECAEDEDGFCIVDGPPTVSAADEVELNPAQKRVYHQQRMNKDLIRELERQEAVLLKIRGRYSRELARMLRRLQETEAERDELQKELMATRREREEARGHGGMAHMAMREAEKKLARSEAERERLQRLLGPVRGDFNGETGASREVLRQVRGESLPEEEREERDSALLRSARMQGEREIMKREQKWEMVCEEKLAKMKEELTGNQDDKLCQECLQGLGDKIRVAAGVVVLMILLRA